MNYIGFWLFMSFPYYWSVVENRTCWLWNLVIVLNLWLHGPIATFFPYGLLFCSFFLPLILVSFPHVLISWFGRNWPGEDFFCLLSSLGAEDLANWELNGGKSQAGKFVHEMDFLFFWGFAASRYKVSFSLKVPPSTFTNQLVTGSAERVEAE